jgi:hypothetical protein
MTSRSWFTFAVLPCAISLLLAPGVPDDMRDASGAVRLGPMTTANASTSNNVGIVLFGLLVGTLLACFFDPGAKKLIWRGIKSLL